MTPPGFSKAEGKCETMTAEKKKKKSRVNQNHILLGFVGAMSF